jgi:hypothetical protein
MPVNRKMRPVERIPATGEVGQRRMMEGVNSSMIYCKNFCKCYNVPPVQQQSVQQQLKKNLVKVESPAIAGE